jgi:hypothetical protein
MAAAAESPDVDTDVAVLQHPVSASTVLCVKPVEADKKVNRIVRHGN